MITVMGKAISVTDLRKMAVTRPELAGGRWQGIQHYTFAHTVAEAIKERGWKIEGSRFTGARHGADLAGAFALTLPGSPAPEGITFGLGLMHGNSRRMAAKLYVGGVVRVCANGFATGELVMRKMHTTGLDLQDEVRNALGRYEIEARRIKWFVKKHMDFKLDFDVYEHLLLEAGRSGAMPWSRLAAVERAYRQPPVDAWAGNAWGLLQAFTATVKRNPPIKQMKQMDTFRCVLANVIDNN